MVPQSRFEQVSPVTERVQVTPLLPESPVTFAVKDWLSLHATVAPGGEIEIEICVVLIRIAALADFVESAAEVAVIVTRPEGAVAGAVYVMDCPLGVDIGETEPQEFVEQETLQLTPLFAVSLMTVAEIDFIPPVCTVAEVGEMETMITGCCWTVLDEFPPPQPRLSALIVAHSAI